MFIFFFICNCSLCVYLCILQNVTETLEIQDDRECISLPAIDIFKHAIKALKDHFEEAAKGRGVVFKPEEVLYVLTVPAIWSETAKEFMKKAALKVSVLDAVAYCIYYKKTNFVSTFMNKLFEISTRIICMYKYGNYF